MKKLIKPVTLVVLMLIPFSVFSQGTVKLNDYLAQVERNNVEVKSYDLAITASKQKINELDMAYSTYFSASGSYTNDKSGVSFGSTLPAKEMDITNWNIGLSKKWSTGSILTLGYSDTSMFFDLLSPTAIVGDTKVSSFSGYQVKPMVKIEQSLLKDFGDGQTQSSISKTKSLNRASIYGQLFKKQQLILKARLSYWSLSLAREVVAFRKTSLDRAEELLKWN